MDKSNGTSLQQTLDEISQEGIRADRKHLKRNMFTQFADPFEFSRELVVNGFDAFATECYISGREETIIGKETVTIIFRDNGKGMNKERIQDYFMIFRSRKDQNQDKAVGKFGVGKLSVAALPGLIRFAGITSTGKECWRFETDSIIEDREIKLEKIKPVPPKGTKFEITIKKEQSLSKVLERVYRVLERYIKHLDIDVYFDLAETDEDLNPIRKKLEKGIWHYPVTALGKSYTTYYKQKPVEIVLGIGNSQHKLYQNKVFITSKYNLVSYGLKDEVLIPNLMIRLNSEAFELTFGRHCLSNENILNSIASKIRNEILPDYYSHIQSWYNEELIMNCYETAKKIDEMTIGLIAFCPSEPKWGCFPVINVFGNTRVSYMRILQETRVKGLVYLEAAENEGTDYSQFDTFVLMQDQPNGAIALLQKVLDQKLVNLNKQDTVIEAPNKKDFELSNEEKLFEEHLVFHQNSDVINDITETLSDIIDEYDIENRNYQGNINKAFNFCEEAQEVSYEIKDLIWKVNYLVERDGKTPCTSRKFLVNGKRIVLNLFHPEIKNFVVLSKKEPELSAHWAMAMCISDTKLLPYVTAETREDIILIDAMSRLGPKHNTAENKYNTEEEFSVLSFIRNCKKRY